MWPILQAKIVFVGLSQTTPAKTDGEKKEVIQRALCVKDLIGEGKLMLWDQQAATVSTGEFIFESNIFC